MIKRFAIDVLLTQLHAYGKSNDGIWVHLYGSSPLCTKDKNGSPIEIVQARTFLNGTLSSLLNDPAMLNKMSEPMLFPHQLFSAYTT